MGNRIFLSDRLPLLFNLLRKSSLWTENLGSEFEIAMVHVEDGNNGLTQARTLG